MIEAYAKTLDAMFSALSKPPKNTERETCPFAPINGCGKDACLKCEEYDRHLERMN